MTPQQRRVLVAIMNLIAEKGYSPTIREIGEEVGLSSSSSVHAHVETLIRLGYLTGKPTGPRTLRPVKQVDTFKGILKQSEVVS